MNKQLIEKLKEIGENNGYFHNPNMCLIERGDLDSVIKALKATEMEYQNLEDNAFVAGYQQALQLKEQLNQESVKLPLSGESKLSAEDMKNKLDDLVDGYDTQKVEYTSGDEEFLYRKGSVIAFGEEIVDLCFQAMHDFANNSEAMKENKEQITDKDIWEWWAIQKFQKEQGDQEYTLIYEVDLPKILKSFIQHFKTEVINEGEITFGNHLQAQFKIVDNKIQILDAVNGWGDNIQTTEIKVEYLTNKEK